MPQSPSTERMVHNLLTNDSTSTIVASLEHANDKVRLRVDLTRLSTEL